MDNKQESCPLWERQPWDTDKSYAAFRDYYLVLERKSRSLSKAYRQWVLKSRSKPVGKKGKPLQPNGLWQQWFRGQDPNGQRLAGTVFEKAVRWDERARAWDAYQDRLWEEDWIVRRRQLRDKEWEISEQLFKRAERMLLAVLYQRESTSEDGKSVIVIKPTDWGEGDTARLIDLASKLGRRSTEMETERVKVDDWRAQLIDAGVDPDLAYRQLVDVIAAQLSGGPSEGVATGSDRSPTPGAE